MNLLRSRKICWNSAQPLMQEDPEPGLELEIDCGKLFSPWGMACNPNRIVHVITEREIKRSRKVQVFS